MSQVLKSTQRLAFRVNGGDVNTHKVNSSVFVFGTDVVRLFGGWTLAKMYFEGVRFVI